MNWWQTVVTVILAVLSSNVVVEMLRNRAAKKAEQVKRAHELEDRAMDKDDKNMTLEERFEEYQKIQTKENQEIRQRLFGVESALGLLTEETSYDKYIDMQKEGLSYIRQGWVYAENRAMLQERYSRYRKISGRNDLDHIMEEVDRLPPRHNEEEI
jgi:putative NIF3 family GTP cyclohydrolase 1 type 2